jgi:hypothetical protein
MRLKNVVRSLMIFGAAATAVFGIASAAQASWYGATTAVNGVNLRSHACADPQPYCGYRGQISSAGTLVNIVCQVSGENVNGAYGWSSIWDYVVVYDGTSYRNEGFVADTNIRTNYNWIPGVDRCQTN